MVEKYVVGIDEVGRGCLAGPVVVAALGMRVGEKISRHSMGLRDSKKMTSGQRIKWAKIIKKESDAGRIFVFISSVFPKKIDRLNISRAANEAAYIAFKKMSDRLSKEIESITLDGGLYLKNKKFQRRISETSGIRAETTVRADSIFAEVMLASIYAKVYRDGKMLRLDRLFPEYGFSKHKGYGTKAHVEAIRLFGPIPKVHRKSFLRAILHREVG